MIEIRLYQVNLTFHGSTDSVLVTNNKNKNFLCPQAHQIWGWSHMVTSMYMYSVVLSSDWGGVNYHVVTVEDGSFFCQVHSWHKCPSTCFSLRFLVYPGPPTSPHFLGRDPPAVHFAAHLLIPCQFQNHLLSLTSLHLAISSNNSSYIIFSSPTSCTSLFLLLLLSVLLLSIKFFFSIYQYEFHKAFSKFHFFFVCFPFLLCALSDWSNPWNIKLIWYHLRKWSACRTLRSVQSVLAERYQKLFAVLLHWNPD